MAVVDDVRVLLAKLGDFFHGVAGFEPRLDETARSFVVGGLSWANIVLLSSSGCCFRREKLPSAILILLTIDMLERLL